MDKNLGLGKGLSALMGDDVVVLNQTVEEAPSVLLDKIVMVMLDALVPSPFQPRRVFNENALNDLKVLKYLYMDSFNFEEDFTIKLNTLKILSISYCRYIKLTENNNYNEKLEQLYLTCNSPLNIDIFVLVNY